MAFSATNLLLQNATRQARVLLVGSGRMGNIRAKALYSSPKYDFAGVVDSNVDEAAKLGNVYRVSFRYHYICVISFHSLYLIPLCNTSDFTLSITKRSNHHPINKTRWYYNLNTNTNTRIINNSSSTSRPINIYRKTN